MVVRPIMSSLPMWSLSIMSMMSWLAWQFAIYLHQFVQIQTSHVVLGVFPIIKFEFTEFHLETAGIESGWG